MASGADQSGVLRGQGAQGDESPALARHVAIIMDGNGRWAARRGVPRAIGHREGVQALKRTVEAAPQFGISCLTVYGFSTENWNRPLDEVSDLMGLVRAYVRSDLERMVRENVRLRVIGQREGVPADILDLIDDAEARTAGNDRFLLQVAFNYGARADLTLAMKRLHADMEAGVIDEITDAAITQRLSTCEAPPLDLIIRTSGEVRLSNFLLWEAAYAELVFQDVLWPDYGPEALSAALEAFRCRQRRFGARPDSMRAAG